MNRRDRAKSRDVRPNRTLEGAERNMLRAALAMMIGFVAAVTAGGIGVHAQVPHGGCRVTESADSGDDRGFTKQNVDLGRLPVWPVDVGRRATRLTIRSDRDLHAVLSRQSGNRRRSKKRIIAGAIAGGIGGFFAGGFLGAHIEGDRCNCDDPGVRGFLIGAPIGAVAGAIAGGKFVF